MTVMFTDKTADRILDWIVQNIDKRYVGYQSSLIDAAVNHFIDTLEKDDALRKKVIEAVKKDAEERTARRGRYAR
jgi:uncharacterized protein YihD (DUF1040 family)